MANRLKILSLSGGGIFGLLQARILVQLEAKLGGRLVDHFDFIAGNSTGSLIAALILTGNYSAQDIVNMYLNNYKTIFSEEFSLDGLINAKYGSFGIESVLKKHFGEMKVSDLLKDCLFPAYDTINRKARFFTKSDNDGTLVWEACRSSTAAPSYFPPFGNFADGGLFANDPGLCAVSEVGIANVDFLLSIGSGSKQEPYNINGWGEVRLIKPLFDMFMSSQEETCERHLRDFLGDKYMFLQPNIDGIDPAMDCISDRNISALIAKPLVFDWDAVVAKIIG